jgi:hypothetical protein
MRQIGTDIYLSTFFLGFPFGFNLKSLLSYPSSLSIKSFVPRDWPVLVFSLIPCSPYSGIFLNSLKSRGSFSLKEKSMGSGLAMTYFS